jgi:glyoxylase-like metal-dependent hydrolase (beta-lactamase superfamily II)/ferredoxin
MANWQKRVPENVEGEFFVDTTCIDCDTCRQLAPRTFGESAEYSFVREQPGSADERRCATQALLACPTGSIGTLGRNEAQTVRKDFPLPIEAEVFYCGFNSAKSYGGNGYFIVHPAGNWLIDSPKNLPHLVNSFSARGGVTNIFLTHRDDVADAARYAQYFGSRRIIHRQELASQPDAEYVLDGDAPLALAEDFLAIPTPGHTAGHCALLYRNRFLFTGDHLAWSRDQQRLGASQDYCWHSWPRQLASLDRLRQFRFEWVLPGHGQRVHLPDLQMQSALQELVERLRK